jgi:SAM-dependent methyltransferase
VIADKNLAVLHFAPEPFMPRLMSGHARYVSVDPELAIASRREDIRSLSFEDASFDVVICHHVLEHVDDDMTALRELRRVLRPGGRAVLSTPINWSRVDTLEDSRLAVPAERAAAYGAVDHIRYYGLDFRERVERAGFRVEVFRKDAEAELKFGLLRDEVLFIATVER